jgi:GNAT superfamily N-acetyltransferase
MSATATPPRVTRRSTIPVARDAKVTIRPIESSDADGILAFYAALSPRARYARFLGICPAIDPTTARRFAAVDHEQRDGVVAVLSHAGRDDGAIVGHVCMEADGSGAEEVAFAVADELQGRGIGTALMDAAVLSARRRGIRRLVGTTFGTNIPMRRVAFGAGPHVTVHQQADGIEEFVIDIAA